MRNRPPEFVGVADVRDHDLRDTAVTWMAQGGATIPEICSATDHSTGSTHTVLEHVLARHPEMTDAAIVKMIERFESGAKVTG